MNKVLFLVFFSFFILASSFASTIYYSQVAAGGGRDVTQLSNWKTSVGGGASPISFLAGDEFHIVSADSMMASVAWNIVGAKLVIESGKFNSSGFSHSFTLDMHASGYYYHSAGIYSNVVFGILDPASGFEFRNGTFISSKTYPNLIVNTSISFPVNGNLVIQGSLTVKNAGNFIFSYTSISSVTIANDFNLLKGNVIAVYSTFNNTLSVGGNMNISGGMFAMSQGSGQLSVNVSGSLNFSNGSLYIAKSSGSVSLSIAGSFNMSGGTFIGTSNSSSVNPTLSIGSNYNVSAGAYYAQNGATGLPTIILSGSGTISLYSAANNYQNVTISGTYTLSGNFPVGKDLVITGTLNIGNFTLSLYNGLDVTMGTLNGGATSNISFLAPSSSNSTLPPVTLQNLTINRTGQTIFLGGDIVVGGSLNNSSGTLAIGNNTLTLNGVYFGAGSITGGATSNVVFSGSSFTNFPSITLNNLTINKTPSTVNVTLNGPITVFGNLNLTSGGILNTSQPLTIGSGATITRSIGTLSAIPTFNGLYLLIYNGSSAINSGFELYSPTPSILEWLTINNTAGVTLNKNIEVNQNLTINPGGIFNASTFSINANSNWINNGGTFTPGTGTVNFKGNTTISGTPAGAHNFYNVSISAGATLTAPASANVNIANNFTSTVTSIFNHNNGTFTFTSAGSQTIPAINFNNFTSTGSGTRTLSNSGTIGMAGNFIPGTNTYTTTGSTVNFNGSSAQNIPAFTFNNLTVSGANVKSLSSGNITVNGILSFSNGVISTGINKVIISALGSVSGSGFGNYVNGNLQKNFALGSGVSRTFEIGNASSYLPITATFATVSVAGNITASTTNNDHAQIASSCINGSESVNRYWTLSNAGVSPASYGVVLNFVAGDLDGGANFNNFEGALYNGSTWLNLTSGSKTSTSIALTGATTFGDFQVGETNAPVSVSIASNPGTTICTGTSVTFTATPINGGALPTYNWKKNNVSVGLGSTFVSNTLANSDVISVDMISNSPCAFNPNATASVTMTVNTASTPTITPSGPTIFCSGGSVTLTSSSAVSYLWSTGATAASIIVSTSGRDSVLITDINGCQAFSAATVVTVNPATTTPTITPSGPTTFCSGGSVTLTSSAASSYLWSTGAITSSIVVSISGKDSVTVTDVNGCQATSAATVVTVNSTTNPVITPSGPTTFCTGGSVTLTSSAGVSYLWSTGATTSSIIISTSGKDSVTVTDVNGCQASSASIVLTANSASTPTITPSGSTTFCSGGNVTLTASSGVSYLWSTGATTSSIIVNTAGSDSVTVTDVNGCQGTSVPTIVTVNSCTFTWNGSSDSNWNNGSNWDIGFAPDSVSDATIPSGTLNILNITGTVRIRSITINSGATPGLSAAGTLNVFGDFVDNGTFTDNGGTTIFKGSSAQAITGASTFANLTLNNASGLTLNSAVTVTKVLSLLKGTLTTNGNLIVDLNTGTVAYNTTDLGSVSGNMTVQKNVNSTKTHYLGCPLGGTTANDFNDDTPVISGANTRLFTLPAGAATFTKIFDLNTPLSPMTPYSLFFVAPTVLDYTGTYTHGATYPALSCTNNAVIFVMVGNPYPSTLDWNNGTGWTKTGINNAIYFWDPVNARNASYVNGTSTNGGTQFIPSLQAFYVTTNNTGGMASISINNNARITSQNPSLWRQAGTENILKIKLNSGSHSDEALIRFNDEATDLFDNEFDAYKMLNPDSTPSVYTGDLKNTYSINTLSKGDKMIPLNVKAGFSGQYTLSIEGTDFDAGTTMVLEDKLLNVKKKLNGNDQYSCTINQGDRADRFSLLVSFSGISNMDGKVFIGSYDKTVNLTFNNAGNSASLKIYNIVGQQIVNVENADISSGSYSYNDSKFSEGIYIVKVSLGNEVYTSKVYIK